MPGYKAHVSFAGFLFFGLIFTIVTVPSWAVGMRWLFFIVVGALFPDIDTNSKGRHLYTLTLLTSILLLVLWAHVYAAFFVALLAFVPLVARHRGVFHSLWFIVVLVFVVAIGVSIFFPVYRSCTIIDSLFFLLGVFSHLVLDRGIVRTLRMRR